MTIISIDSNMARFWADHESSLKISHETVYYYTTLIAIAGGFYFMILTVSCSMNLFFLTEWSHKQQKLLKRQCKVKTCLNKIKSVLCEHKPLTFILSIIYQNVSFSTYTIKSVYFFVSPRFVLKECLAENRKLHGQSWFDNMP